MLEVKNLKSGYGDVTVLKNINIKVKKGQVVSIIGYNGAGKSTLVNTISGIIVNTEGGISVDGRNISGLSPKEIVKIGITQIPEGRKLFNSMSVRQNLEMGSFLNKNKGEREKNIKEVYEIFPILEERKNQSAGTLSGGEQQMLAIGRGIMAKPKYMIFDEPSLGVAPIIVKSIIEAIKHIKNEGTGVLLVEQNLVQALAISDYGYILEDGNISKEGKGEAMLQDDKTKKAYLGL